MSLRLLLAGVAFLPLIPTLGVCSPEPETPSPSGPGEIEQPSVQSALLGRIWQLVEIVSMNDRVDAPDDRSLHEFYEPGSEQEARAFTRPPWAGEAGGE